MDAPELSHLPKNIGPLPTVAWVAVVAAGLWFAHSRSTASSTSPDATTASDIVPSPDNAASDSPYQGGGEASPTPAQIIVLPIAMPSAGVPHPTAPHPKAAPHPTAHYVIVRPGDTITSVAHRVHRSPAALYERNRATIEAAARRHHRANSANGRYLYSGDRLVIP